MNLKKRLTHTSYDAYKRSMQMSRAQLFLFIEGKTDRYFYDKVCCAFLKSKNVEYSIVLAQELPSGTPGKQSLLDFYRYLNDTSSLLDEFKGEKTVVIFYLDKDIDDILNKTITSEYIVYTEYYDIDNYIFKYGNLIEAVAAGASLDHKSISARLKIENSNWQQRAAENWKEWVILCVFCQINNIAYESNYSVRSKVNKKPYEPYKKRLYRAFLSKIKSKLRVNKDEFLKKLSEIELQVTELYKIGKFDILFKGKWYIYFLEEDSKIIANTRAFDSNGLQERLRSCLLMTVNFSNAWATHFKRPLENMLAKVGY